MGRKEKLTDVPADKVAEVVKNLKVAGATVEIIPQPDGNFTVIATFPNGEESGKD